MRAGLVVFAQLSHQAAYSDILSNGRANIWAVFRALDYLPKVTVVYFLRVRRGTSQHQTRDTNAGGGGVRRNKRHRRRSMSQHKTCDTNAGEGVCHNTRRERRRSMSQHKNPRGGVCRNTRRVTPTPEEEYVATTVN